MGEALPTLSVKVGDGILAANTNIGFTTSNTQARQLVNDGAVYLGDRKITDPGYKFGPNDFDANRRALLRVGAKRRGILTLESE